MNKELAHLEEGIDEWYTFLKDRLYSAIKYYDEDQFREYFHQYEKYQVEFAFDTLYCLLQVYLEEKGLTTYLQEFKTAIQTFKSSTSVEDLASNEDGDYYAPILVLLRKYLTPFPKISGVNLQPDEIRKLKEILESTGEILRKLKVTPKKEADIYIEVHWLLGQYYHSTKRKNKARFISKFKTYNPDILIPELRTAIEYKYIDNGKKIVDNFLDQLKADESVYINDPEYDNFIAVLCIKNSVISKSSIKHAWEIREFKKNWSFIVVNL